MLAGDAGTRGGDDATTTTAVMMTTAATTGERRRRLVRRLTELRGDDGCGDDGAALGCTVAEGWR